MSRRGQILFFVPAILVFLVFVLIPCTVTLGNSFFAFGREGPEFVGMRQYAFALSDPEFLGAFRNNVVYLLWTLLFEVAVGLFLAVQLEREGRLNNWLRLAFFSPAVLSMVVVGLVFGFMFKEGIGWFPGMLSEGRALLTISAISGWAYCGFYMVIFLGGLAQIPPELLEAARLDGAGEWGLFWGIKLPLLWEVLATVLLICVTGAFKAFDLFWVMLPNQEHTAIVSTLLVKEFVRFDHRGYGCTLAVLLTALALGSAGMVFGAKHWLSPTRERAHGK